MVKSEYKLVRVNIEDIQYIESLREYIRIFTASGSILTLDTMKNMEAVLPQGRFARIHKSYIVSMDRVASIQGNQVEIAGRLLPLGRSYKDAFMELLNRGE